MSRSRIPRQRTRVMRATDRFRMLQTECGTLNVQPEESEPQPPDETPGGGGGGGGSGGGQDGETGTQTRALIAIGFAAAGLLLFALL